MSIRINLHQDKEKLLEQAAKKHGMEVSEYARMLLEEDLSRLSKGKCRMTYGMFPELKNVTEEDFKRAEWHGRIDDF